MANKRDYYEVLGVNKSASKDEIKSAYRKLAKTYHPDNKETGDEAKFKEVQEAYDILYDDQKRQAYDQFGHAAFEQAGGNPGANPFEGGFGGFGFGGDAGVDLGDIFSSFFGGRRSGGNATGPRRGNDILQRVKIDFMDSINGKDIEITLDHDETCKTCGGTGAKTPNDVSTCSQCGGRGVVRIKRQTILGAMTSEETCSLCGGSGKTIKNKCPDCQGLGYKHTRVKMPVHIPAGISSGQQIRKSGYGERGRNGGPNGDLFVEILVKEHPSFQREGNNIHIEIPIDLVDVCLGAKVDIPTVYGEKELTIPEGTQPGQILKMKGCGVKDLRTGKPGDQYVHLNIKVPTSLTKEQKELLKKFKEAGKNESWFSKFKKSFKK